MRDAFSKRLGDIEPFDEATNLSILQRIHRYRTYSQAAFVIECVTEGSARGDPREAGLR
jgi:hypothetical protein